MGKLMRAAIVIALAAAGALAGCAGLKMENAPAGYSDTSAEGFRYYDTSPFFLVYTDGKGGIKSQVLYLPDKQKKRSIKPYAYGAKNDTTLKFENGMLKEAKAVVDETVIPVAAISTLEKIATSLVKAANGGADGIPAPYLFRIQWNKALQTWSLEGGQATPATIRYVSP